MIDLSNVSTNDLIDALKDRKDVDYIVNDRSSRDYAVMIEDGKWIKGTGETIILAVKGLY